MPRKLEDTSIHGFPHAFINRRGEPILVAHPDSEAARVFREIAGRIARKLALLAERTPTIADANITWVSEPA